MRLFTKTVIFILLLILFQAVLTGILVTRITAGNNRLDARIELQREAGVISNSFNSWKRHLWKQLIRIKNYTESSRNRDLSKEEISRLLTATNVDAVIVKSGGSSFIIETISSSGDFILPPSEALTIYYSHPYIRLYRINRELYLIGVIGLTTSTGRHDVFLIKHVNESFLKNIIFDTRSRVVFHTRDNYLAGNFSDPGIVSGQKNSLEGNSYFEFYGVSRNSGLWNLSVQKVGTFDGPYGSEIVYLTTVVSHDPYNKRVIDIEKTVLQVSVFLMLISVLLTLLISRSITRPIKLLSSAMKLIREGSYEIQLEQRSRDEVGKLMEGFNEMSLHLKQDQKKIQDSLRQITFLNEYNETLFNSLKDSIAVIDEELNIEKANDSFCTLFFDESGPRHGNLRQLNSSVFSPPVLSNITGVLSGRLNFWSQKHRTTRSEIWELRIYPLDVDSEACPRTRRCILILEDVGQKVKYEEKIFQAEKLASLSIMSAGVAHEINNPLSSILTNIQNLLYDETDRDRRESLLLVEKESHRIAGIIRTLLDFTGEEQNVMPAASPRMVALEVARLLRTSEINTAREKPEIQVECPENLPQAAITRGELMQIFINLLQNSLHAAVDLSPVRITIKEDGDAKDSLFFSVTDRGCGISPEDLPRVFDPFFSTKTDGEGTGLGLSLVYGIIKKYKGSIHISSVPGEGTEIDFRIPVYSGTKEDE